MSAMPAVTWSVDTTSLVRAFGLAAASSTRQMRNVVESAGFHIARKAQKYTPAATIENIDAGLEVVDHVSGPRTKWGKSQNLGGLVWTRGMMIAVMRTNPNSPYSLATDNRWPLAYTKGMKGVERWRFFKSAEDRMRAGRHSSTHFLQKGWGDVCRKLKAGFTRSASSPVIDIETEVVGADGESDQNKLGAVSRGGSAVMPWLQIENLIGMDTAYPNLSKRRNDALFLHGSGPLQRAVDEQAQEMQNRYLPRVLAQLEHEWNAIP